MKKIAFTLAATLVLASCSTSSNTKQTTTTNNGTLDTITKVAQITSTISELSNLLGGLNLTDSQSSLVKKALVSYVTDYSGLNTGASNYTSLLNGLKSETLNEIQTGLGTTKYNEVFSALKTFSTTNNNKINKTDKTEIIDNLAIEAISALIKK